MFCAQCGTQNDSGSSFCRNCGQPLQAAATVPVAAQNQAQSGQRYQPYPNQGAGSQAYQPYQQAAPYVPQGQVAYQQPQAPEGVLIAAWHDITGTQGWFKKVLLLCLIGCVPILNFAVAGYALRWARQLSFGERTSLPKEIFKKREILTGFRATLAQLSLGFIFGVLALLAILLLSAFFGLFSTQAGVVMGIIAFTVLCVGFVFFYSPFVNVSVMRMAVIDYLEAAFNLPRSFAAYRRSMGGAIAAAVVPPLAIGVIGAVISAIFMLIIGALAASASSPAYGYGYGYPYGLHDSGPFDALLAAGAGVILCYLVLEIILAMLGTFAMLLSWRAMGHWAYRNAAEWAAESEAGANVAADARETEGPASRQDAPQADPVAAADLPTQVVAPVPSPDGATAKMDATAASRISLTRKATGAVYDLDTLPVTLGKGTTADVSVEGTDSISRVHARIARSDAGFTVEDLNATNGTSVNGVKIDAGIPVPLSDGDTLTLADEEFTVSIR